MSTQQVALGSTFNYVSGNQYNYNRVESGSSSSQAPILPSIEAPINLLSTYFTGREKELDDIAKTLDIVHGDIPTRCVIYGMHGIGKTQLALQFAKQCYDQQQYSHTFWISATTIEKLNQGFTDLLTRVHPGQSNQVDQSARPKAAQRWLEDASSIDWLLVLDNVDPIVLGFLQKHLPRKNQRGKILFTTRTEIIATALARSAGKRHHIFELGLPKIEDATSLLLVESDADVAAGTTLIKSKAEDVVKFIGRLPLAISHAASFMKHTHRNLDDILHLFRSEHQPWVCSNITLFCVVKPLIPHDSSSAGRTRCQHTKQSLLRQHSLLNSMIWNINLQMQAIC
jgi:NB-ARC domain